MKDLRIVKTSLKSIASPSVRFKICDVVYRTNQVVINAYQFIKLYVLDQYERFHHVPIINESFIRCCFGIVGFCSKVGRKVSVNKDLMKQLNIFYESRFKDIQKEKIPIKNMGQILLYQATDMLTNIENNIYMHFNKYIKNLMIMWCKTCDTSINRKYITNITNRIMYKDQLNHTTIELLYRLTELQTNINLHKTHVQYEKILKQLVLDGNPNAQQYMNSYSKFVTLDPLRNADPHIIKELKVKLKNFKREFMLRKFDFIADIRRLIKKINKLELVIQKIKSDIQFTKIIKVHHVLSNKIRECNKMNVKCFRDLLNIEYLDKINKIDAKINNYYLQIFYYTMANRIVEHYLPRIPNNKSTAYQIKVTPYKYLYYMIKINREVERYNNELSVEDGCLKQKLYQVLPQRSSVSPKYILIDTKVVQDILIGHGKLQLDRQETEGATNNNKNKKIWKLGFPKLYEGKNKKLMETATHLFNNIIYTDGYAVSISQVARKAEARDPNYKKKRAKVRKKKLKNIDELSKKELKELNEFELVGIDPGKRNILTMVNYATDNKKTKKMKYTCQQRQVECLHKHSKKKLEEHKTQEVRDQEELISKTNSKSSYTDSFAKYVEVKNKANKEILLRHYAGKIYRKFKWKRYIHTQQSEAKLVNNIKKTYGKEKNVCLAFGNWGQPKQMPNNYPTPNIGIRNMLAKHFKVVLVDEYKTSKLCCNCYSETRNLMVKDGLDSGPNPFYVCSKGTCKRRIPPNPYKKGSKPIHSLLCCTNIDCNKLYNRDVNGSSNILNIALHHVKYNERLEQFRRGNNISSF